MFLCLNRRRCADLTKPAACEKQKSIDAGGTQMSTRVTNFLITAAIAIWAGFAVITLAVVTVPLVIAAVRGMLG